MSDAQFLMIILERKRQACLKYNGEQKMQNIITCDFFVLCPHSLSYFTKYNKNKRNDRHYDVLKEEYITY